MSRGGLVAAVGMMLKKTSSTPPDTGHRFWRLYANAVNSGTQWAVQELQMRETVGGVDLCTPTTVITASSTYDDNPAYGPAKAVDGTYEGGGTGFWSAKDAAPQWLALDFLTPKDIKSLTIYPVDTGAANSTAASNFSLQWSDDNSDWTTVQTWGGMTTGWVAGTGRRFLVTPVPVAGWDAATVVSPLELSSPAVVTLPTGYSAIAKTVKSNVALTGKCYWEVLISSCIPSGGPTTGAGIAESTFNFGGANLGNNSTIDSGGMWLNGNMYFEGSVAFSSGWSFDPGQSMMFAFDADTGRLWVGKLGIGWYGNPGANTTPVRVLNPAKVYYPAATPWSADSTHAVVMEIRGNGTVLGAPPSGFTAIGAAP